MYRVLIRCVLVVLCINGQCCINKGSLAWAQEKKTEISAEAYWRLKVLGSLFDVSESATEVTGKAKGYHAVIAFRIPKSKLKDMEAKTRGYKEAVRYLAWLAKDYPKTGSESISILKALTGEQFANPAGWKGWFQSNADYLVWSEQKGRLIIDEDAKKAGVPALEFRKRRLLKKGR